MKRVFTASNITDAGLMRSFLEQHDIPTMLRNEHVSGGIGELPFMDSSPELWVEDLLHARALALVKEAQKPVSTDMRDWVCSECREENPASFELCWQCSKAQ